jgi:hypothetical protein
MGRSAAGERGVLRAAVLAGLSALLAAAGHAASGGALPDLALMVVFLPLLACLFISAAERSRSVPGTVAVLAVGQLALHSLIEALHDSHHAAQAAPAAGAGMLVMHAGATLITAAALHLAERAVAAVGAALRRVVPRRLSPPVCDRPLPTFVVPGPAVILRLARALAVAHVRRGPPVGC